jgi:hypothetical protein
MLAHFLLPDRPETDMLYRGNDLDLRVDGADGPRGSAGDDRANGALPVPAGEAANAIRVDEAVMACCNDAYDAAAFHRAGEIRLDHLLHGMTRVAAAAGVLEQHGIRTPELRRETAIAIASHGAEAPLTVPTAPQTSPELEQVLRMAAERAAMRRASASVEDLLRALLLGGREAPAAALLLRTADDAEALERWRDAPLQAPAPEIGAEPEPSAHALNQAVDRLVALDASLREVHGEVSADRRRMSKLVRDIQNELQALRAEGTGKPGSEQMQALEAAVEKRLSGLDQMVATLSARTASADQLISRQDGSSAPIEELMAGVAHSFSERLAQTEAALQRLQDESARHWNATSERLVTLEAMVRAQLEGADDTGKRHDQDLREVHEAMVKLTSSHDALGKTLSSWQLDNSGDVGIISNRLEQLEQTALEVLGQLSADVQSMREQMDGGQLRSGFKRWLYGTTSVFGGSGGDSDDGNPPRRTLTQNINRVLNRAGGDRKS